MNPHLAQLVFLAATMGAMRMWGAGTSRRDVMWRWLWSAALLVGVVLEVTVCLQDGSNIYLFVYPLFLAAAPALPWDRRAWKKGVRP